MKKFLKIPVYSKGAFVRNEQISLDGIAGMGPTQFPTTIPIYYNNGVTVLIGPPRGSSFAPGDFEILQRIVIKAIQSNWKEVLFDLPPLSTDVEEVIVGL